MKLIKNSCNAATNLCFVWFYIKWQTKGKPGRNPVIILVFVRLQSSFCCPGNSRPRLGLVSREGLQSEDYFPPMVGTKFFFVSPQTQIRKFFDSFRNRKSTNFWGVPVRKSQIRKFLMINPQIANPKISLVSQSAIANPLVCKEKAVFLIHIRKTVPKAESRF